MTYMLDTNTCIYAMKKQGKVLSRLMRHDPEDICISSITYAELCYGVDKSNYPDKNRLALMMFLSEISIKPFDTSAAEEYGTIRSALERAGLPIGPLDMLIASHAKALGAVIVTNNMKEFKRIKGLKMEDWK